MSQARVLLWTAIALTGAAAYQYGPGAAVLCALAALVGAWWWLSVDEGW